MLNIQAGLMLLIMIINLKMKAGGKERKPAKIWREFLWWRESEREKGNKDSKREARWKRSRKKQYVESGIVSENVKRGKEENVFPRIAMNENFQRLKCIFKVREERGGEGRK